ncbi:hypothetical protein GCM10009867_24620 [Pedococcus aerophilus]|uniref:Uncharacterized protein n=1 Tax=Pedococcus aerophilus TaxID=436356 RepID=A0ABN3UR44_9MICO
MRSAAATARYGQAAGADGQVIDSLPCGIEQGDVATAAVAQVQGRPAAGALEGRAPSRDAAARDLPDLGGQGSDRQGARRRRIACHDPSVPLDRTPRLGQMDEQGWRATDTSRARGR